MFYGIPKPWRVEGNSSLTRERKKKMRNERDEKAFFLPQIGTTLQMKIMHLEGGDKMEEKIALEVFKVVLPSQLLVPLPVGHDVFC